MKLIVCLAGFLVLSATPMGAAAAEPASVSPGPAEAGKAAARSIAHVDATGAAKLVSGKKVKILDIRTPEEYAEGHLRGAALINFSAPDFKQKLAALDRKQPYLLYCRSGNRSTKSLPVFQELGFEAVTHLDGGILAWTKAGQPVEKGAPAR